MIKKINNNNRDLYEGDISYRESALFVEKSKTTPYVKLLHNCDKILKIENLSGTIEYIEGEDFLFNNNKIYLTDSSSIPRVNEEFPKASIEMTQVAYKHIDGDYLYYSGGNLQLKQVFITYHIKKRNKIYCPDKSEVLFNFKKKIEENEKLNIVIYGDSISVGHDCSSNMRVEPYMPNWGEQLKKYIQDNSESKVNIINNSIGGKTSTWAKENFDKNVRILKPDLLIIAFGMNDGSSYMNHKEFQNNIKTMIDKTSNNTDVIVISTMLPAPYSAKADNIPFYGYQKEYKSYLMELKTNRVEVFDMTRIHENILKYKDYKDLSGNNINHPNDYLTRWYAIGLGKLLMG